MSIDKITKKINHFKLFVVLFILVTVGIVSFILGRISMQGTMSSQNPTAASGVRQTKEGITIHYPNNYEELLQVSEANQGNAAYLASKNGTKYYPLNCTSANRISETNKVFFQSEAEAQLAGFERTKQCKF